MTDNSARRSVIVVGGGAIGSSVALECAKAGHVVTMVDGASGGDRRACSFGSSGLICPSVAEPLATAAMVADGVKAVLQRSESFGVKPHRGLTRWLSGFGMNAFRSHTVKMRSIAIRAMALDSLRRHISYADSGIATSLRRNGILYVYRGSRRASKTTMPVGETLTDEYWSGELLRLRAPNLGTSMTGVFRPWEAHCDSGRYVSAVWERCRELGVIICDHQQAAQVLTRGGRAYGVQTGTGAVIEADVVVVAAGVHSRRLVQTAGVDIPLEPGHGYHVELESVPTDPEMPLYLSGGHMIVTPLEGRLRLAGGLRLNGMMKSQPNGQVGRMVHEASDWIPQIDHRRVLSSWSGMRPCMSDGIPVIGPIDASSSLVIATGHGMLGISLAPITGCMVADFVSGQPLPWYASMLSPFRFANGPAYLVA